MPGDGFDDLFGTTAPHWVEVWGPWSVDMRGNKYPLSPADEEEAAKARRGTAHIKIGHSPEHSCT